MCVQIFHIVSIDVPAVVGAQQNPSANSTYYLVSQAFGLLFLGW